MEASEFAELKRFIDHCKSNPSILHHPSLAFFKNYLQSVGARIPKAEKTEETAESMADKGQSSYEEKPSSVSENDEIVESDVELDDAGTEEPDNDPPQPMGDPTAEITEEKRDAAQSEKLKAMDAISEGKLEEARDHFTQAIMLNPTSAILYAARAAVFLQMKKPNAAICDANAALQFNPDSAKGYKARGIARAMLGLWEEAARDLHLASSLDHDEEIGAMLKKVEPNAKKIEEHRRKYERLRKEMELKRVEHERRLQKEAQERDSLGALKDGQVIGIQSQNEMESKMNAATKTSRLLILYFTATWCGPCRFISPLYTNLASQHPKVVFLKVDIDEAPNVAAAWNISSVPTFIFVKKGREVDKLVGADKSSLESKISQHAP